MHTNETFEAMLTAAEKESCRLGIAGLRPLQREVLGHLAMGCSVFAGLPTGYGKSLCYWMPAAAWGWKVWVVSPLVSLIEDQAITANALGLKTIRWVGKLTQIERTSLERRMGTGDWQICFLSPERLLEWERSGYWKHLQGFGQDADLLVLDEMHCFEEWREFRAGYKGLFESVRCATEQGTSLLGLSATLAAKESQAWMNELCGEHVQVVSDIGRPNLKLQVLALEEEETRWLFLLASLREIRPPESALVYCATREETDEVARWLRSAGITAIPYHAGLPAEERSSRSRAFREGRLRVVCATSAFGMGIDYPHVTRVVHFSLPYSLEAYWQEVSRAGRRGQSAEAIVFWRRSEITRARIMHGDALQRFVAMWLSWAEGKCRKRSVAERLGLPLADCGNCDHCNRQKDFVSILGPRVSDSWWIQREATLPEWVADRLQAAISSR